MKALTLYINEWLIKKKVDKVRGYKYIPQTKNELIVNIKELLDQGETNLNCIDVSNITDMSELFYDIPYSHNINFDVSGWDVSNVKDMSYMFGNCSNFNCDLFNWNVSKVKNTAVMFKSCENFEGKGLENWNVSNTTNCNYMFYNCKKLNVDLSKWNVKKARFQLTRMFYGCTSLKNIPSWYKE